MKLNLLSVTATLALLLSAPALAQSQPITLRVTGWGPQDSFKKMNDLFMAANPGIKIENSVTPNEQSVTVYNARFSAGDAPDVLVTNGVTSPSQWAKAGYLADLSREPWVKNVIKGNRPEVFLGGTKAYQFVIENIGVGVYYNKALLDAAGVKVPQTYPEFLDAMAKVKASGKTPLVIGAKLGWGPLMATMMNAVNTIYKSNTQTYDKQLVAGKAKFDSSAWKQVNQRLVDWAKAGYFDPKLALGIEDFDGVAGEFRAGRAAFIIHGSWLIDGFKGGSQDANGRTVPALPFAWGFQSFPGGAAGSKPRTFIFAGLNFVANAKSKNLDAAKKYINFWADNIDTYLAASGGRYASVTTSKYSEAQSAEFARAVAENRANLYFINNWNKPGFQEAWYKILQQMLIDQNVDNAVKAMDTEFNKK